MDINRYLAELIRAKRILVVPGLGTFTKADIPATYDAGTQTFLPPSAQILFSNDFSEDPSFIEFISQKENLEPENVQNFLAAYIQNLHDLLATTELIKIDQLGTFEKEEDGFRFEADPGLLSQAYFGLKPIKDLAAPQTAPQPTTSIDPEPVDEAENTEFNPEEIEEEAASPSGSTGKTLLLILALVLVIIAGIQVFYPQAFDLLKSEAPKTEENRVPAVQADTIPAVDTTVLDTSVVADTPKVVAAPVVPNEPTYEIVIAAFGKRSEADAFIQQLAKRGVTAHALPNRKKEFIKISIGTFNDPQQAQTELQRVQKELSKGAWIFKVKPIKQTIHVSPTN